MGVLMRVLIFIEPHPIRNSFDHFRDIAKRFFPLLKNCPPLDVRIFANNKTIESFPPEDLKMISSRIVRTSAAEEELIKSNAIDWDDKGIAHWKNLMDGGAVSDDYVKILRRIWDIFPFDTIMSWGENGAITRFRQERPFKRISLELGCTRPPFFNSIVMDPFGTNGAGLIPRLSIKDIEKIVDFQEMSCEEALMMYSENIEAKAYEDQFQPFPREISAQLFPLRGKFAFLPLQCYDDANLLEFSPYNTLTEVVREVVPKLADAGYVTIIKCHPASRFRPNALAANAMARSALQDLKDKFIWLDSVDDNYSNVQLILLSDVVVTVNSSVGFEATYYDKPVVVLGDAVYKPEGLFPKLDDITTGDFDFDFVEYRRNLGYLRNFILTAYLQPENIFNIPSEIRQIIALFNHLCDEHSYDPFGIAQGLYRSTGPLKRSVARDNAYFGTSVPGNDEFKKPELPVARSVAEGGTEPNSPLLVPTSLLIKESRAKNSLEFSTWLLASMRDKKKLEHVIKVSKILDPIYYQRTYPDVAIARIDPEIHYACHGISEGRSPRESLQNIHETDLVNLIGEQASLLFDYPLLPIYPLSEKQEASRVSQLTLISDILSRSSNKICVILHAFYSDLTVEILEYLKNIEEPYDLLVTTTDWGNKKIESDIISIHPKALFFRTPNRGRDIGPFIDILPLITKKNYDAVLKIQTKRGYYFAGRLMPEFGQMWRQEALECLVGSTDAASAIIDAFRKDPSLSMVGPAPYAASLKDYPYHDGGLLADYILKEGTPHTDGVFFAGTMFWFRPDCLAPLLETGISISSFAPEDGKSDGNLCHLLERVFGQLATSVHWHTSSIGPGQSALIKTQTNTGIKIHDHLQATARSGRDNSVNDGRLIW